MFMVSITITIKSNIIVTIIMTRIGKLKFSRKVKPILIFTFVFAYLYLRLCVFVFVSLHIFICVFAHLYFCIYVFVATMWRARGMTTSQQPKRERVNVQSSKDFQKSSLGTFCPIRGGREARKRNIAAGARKCI